jgi:hypothetical protein
MRSVAFVCAPAAFVLLSVAGFAQLTPQVYRELEEHVPHGYRPFMALDVDVDGALDLVAPEGVLKNDGTGRFTPLAVSPFVAGILFFSDVRVALDLNGDGFDDLVVIAPDAVLVRTIYALVSGPGGLTPAAPATTFPPGPAPTALAAFDFDSDGFDDLVAGAASTASAAVWLNGGGAVFVDVSAAAVGGALPTGALVPVASGDFDGDLARDVLLADNAAVGGYVLTAGSGSISVAPVAGLPIGTSIKKVVVGAFDAVPGDDVMGNVQGAASYRFGIRYVAGVPTYQALGGALPPPSALQPTSSAIAAIDLDGDGVDELAYAFVGGLGGPTINVVADYFGAATTKAALIDAPEVSFAFDADGDGDRDLLATRANFNPRIVFVDASEGIYEARSDLFFAASTGSAPTTLEALVGDFDGDGDVDVARDADLICPEYPLFLLENDGRGRFPTSSLSDFCVASGVLTASVVADFDGDGRDDILRAEKQSSNAASPIFFTLRSLTAGGWVATTVGFEFGSLRAFRVLDLGQDGDPDVFVALTAGARFSIYTNDGGVFTRSTVWNGGQIDDAVYADVTGDGTPDYLFSAPASGGAQLVKMTDGATLAPPVIVGNGTRISAADFDGDGDTDLLLDATVRENLGGGFWALGQTLAGYPQAVAGPFLPAVVLDANADGDPDVLAYGALWLGGAGVTFGAPQTVPFPSVGFAQIPIMPHYRPADFDRDGDLDLLDPIGRLISNTTRHLALGAQPSIGRTGSLEAYGPTLQPCDLFASFNAFEQNPIAVPGWGNLFLVPEASVYVGAFGTDGTGRAVVPFVVPNDPALVGLTLHFQAALPVVGKLTNAETVRILAL